MNLLHQWVNRILVAYGKTPAERGTYGCILDDVTKEYERLYILEESQYDTLWEHLRLLLKVWRDWNLTWKRNKKDKETLYRHRDFFNDCIQSLYEENRHLSARQEPAFESPSWLDD
jgi:hypothetical protein